MTELPPIPPVRPQTRALCGGYCSWRMPPQQPPTLGYRDPLCPVHGNTAPSRGSRLRIERGRAGSDA